MSFDAPLLLTFVAYLILILFLGIKAYRRTHSLDDYILGDRKLGSVVTALSVGASDMSGWLLLGLPGAIYLSGLSEIWIGIGLVLGAYCNWLFVSKRLRIYSAQANNSLTLPDYFENRFNDTTRVLRLVSAFVILLFFTFYTASGLVGGAILFENSFGMQYSTALISGGLIIVGYTFIGGFLAVVWTDAVQAVLMFLALLVAPTVVILSSGGTEAVWQQMQAVNPQSTELFSNMTLIGFLSLIAWGLGYVGQPHILARFMAVENPQKLVAARRIAMVWMVLVLFGSVATGLAGIAYFADNPLENPETVFIALSQQSEKELLMVSRGAVIAIALLAMVIASDRESRVLDLVSYAWAGFGAAFGPVIVFSLFWRSMTAASAIAGMIVGAVTVVVWSNLTGGLFDLYEIVPGFAFASMVIVIITTLKPASDAQALSTFEEVEQLVKD